MTRDVQTCDPNDLLIDVLKRMSEGRFRHTPVVASGHLCGIVTIGDVVQFRLKELEYEALRIEQMIVVYKVPIHKYPRVGTGADESRLQTDDP